MSSSQNNFIDSISSYSMATLKPIVKLQRICTGIQCPGCIELFYVEDECAAHLLKSCIRFRSNNTSESRRNLATWIVDYFKTHTYGDENPPDSVKINSLLNDDRFNMSTKAFVRVKIPALSSSICCPVCRTYSFTPEVCFEHLFSKCLFVETEISQVRDWLCEYFSSKSEKNLNVLRDVLSTYSAARVTCKYCKMEAIDKESLMKHFPCPQQRVPSASELMCELCNFSVPNQHSLISHLISKHYKCHACGIWPKNRRVDFNTFAHHMRSCDPQRQLFFRCPLCIEDVPVQAQLDLKSHIASCRRERVDRALDNGSLFGKCDIINCTDQILLCDIDAHVMKHLKNGDLPSSRQKRLRVSVNDLKNFVGNSFSDRKNTDCCCQGNVR